jgi:hypothetical protein
VTRPARPERRMDKRRREVLALLRNPILIAYARGQRPKQIVLSLYGSQIAAERQKNGEEAAEKLWRARLRSVERRIEKAV